MLFTEYYSVNRKLPQVSLHHETQKNMYQCKLNEYETLSCNSHINIVVLVSFIGKHGSRIMLHRRDIKGNNSKVSVD